MGIKNVKIQPPVKKGPGVASSWQDALDDLGPTTSDGTRHPALDQLDNPDDSSEPIMHPQPLDGLDAGTGSAEPSLLAEPDVLTRFKSSREEVTIRTEVGDYIFKAVKVIASASSVVLLFDIDNGGPMFSPKPLSVFALVHLGKEYNCFYPGLKADIEELGLRLLCLGINNSEQTHEEVQAEDNQ